MKPTTLCPCGSGKPQVRCCGDTRKSKIKLRAIVTWSFIILLGCAITVIAFTRPSDEAQIPDVGATPAPYQYDPITKKHWDPLHGHWHDGLPPAGATNRSVQLSDSGNPAAAFPINPTISTTAVGTGAASGTPVSAPPNITNPGPWQYDAVTDRHYDPNHSHWHSGRPPTDPGSAGPGSTTGKQVPAPPNVLNPQPWQYDAATDRYFDPSPSHRHWHAGSPPTDPSGVIGAASGSQVTAPPHIPNPEPWQYDTVTDRHYDPNHGHWHSGLPTGGN